MNAHVQKMRQNLDVLLETLTILKSALTKEDDDKAHEAISVMIMQGLHLFGAESVAMKQFFPVMDVIKRRIDGLDLAGALRQAELFETQINEIKTLITQG